MRTGTLTRLETSDQGTFGLLVLDDGHTCATLELPWRNNARKRSCVPAGVYCFRLRKDSPKHGECYEEWDDPETPEQEDVAGRDCVQIHAANLAGDVSKGFVSQLEGCIAPGLGPANFSAGITPAGKRDQRGVTGSRAALMGLMRNLNGVDLKLKVRWAPNVSPEGKE